MFDWVERKGIEFHGMEKVFMEKKQSWEVVLGSKEEKIWGETICIMEIDFIGSKYNQNR